MDPSLLTKWMKDQAIGLEEDPKLKEGPRKYLPQLAVLRSLANPHLTNQEPCPCLRVGVVSLTIRSLT
uniref:Uncharacterized protein n=1 Tax=Picea glauca TaxID=3330 RepID=A0A101M301_PICGL|nr:hypothetical protein ABT39_MTgene3187 [Picea glauca]QHR88211.1 hypothetical protein Q903MT_gene2224 [Picea sitchensis]